MPQQVYQTVDDTDVSELKRYLNWYCNQENEEAVSFIMVENVSTCNFIKRVILDLMDENRVAELFEIQDLIQSPQSKIKPQDKAYFSAYSSAISSYLAENTSLASLSFTH